MKKILLMVAVAIACLSCKSSYEATTVELNNQNDSINYAFGYANGAQIKMQFFRGDSTAKPIDQFMNAFGAGYAGKWSNTSEFQKIGTEVGVQFYKAATKGVAQQPQWPVDMAIMLQAMVNGLQHDTVMMDVTTAMDYFQANVQAATPFYGDTTVEYKKGKCVTTVKAIELTNQLDSMNYVYGYLSGDNLGKQVLDGDTTGTAFDDFMKGFKEGLAIEGRYPELTLIGTMVGENLRTEGLGGLLQVPVDTDIELIKQGLVNGFYGYDQMNVQSASAYINSTIMGLKHAPAKAAGEAFLAENALREEVVVTESGLQYEVLKAGKGKKPTTEDQVKVHYEGTLIDGTVFDSSYKRGEPIVFGVTQVIPGWTEALQLMNVGSKWKVYIPYNLGYGENGAGRDIPPYATLIFTVELLGIE